MPIAPEDRNLFIANALLFPSHFPQLGIASMKAGENSTLRLATGDMKPNIVNFSEDRVIWSIARSVLAKRVAAVFIPGNVTIEWCTGAWWNNGIWLAGGELAHDADVIACASQVGQPDPQDDGKKYALLYLPEDAPISNNVTFAASAAESHQFVPPVGDAVYRCCCPCHA